MEVLSKHEIAQNVLTYYSKHKETLQRGLESYQETQGKGFICWRFLMNETVRKAAEEQNVPSKRGGSAVREICNDETSPGIGKRPRSNENGGEDADAVADGLAKNLDI